MNSSRITKSIVFIVAILGLCVAPLSPHFMSSAIADPSASTVELKPRSLSAAKVDQSRLEKGAAGTAVDQALGSIVSLGESGSPVSPGTSDYSGTTKEWREWTAWENWSCRCSKKRTEATRNSKFALKFLLRRISIPYRSARWFWDCFSNCSSRTRTRINSKIISSRISPTNRISRINRTLLRPNQIRRQPLTLQCNRLHQFPQVSNHYSLIFREGPTVGLVVDDAFELEAQVRFSSLKKTRCIPSWRACLVTMMVRVWTLTKS